MKKTSPWAWIPTLYFAEGLPNVVVTALSIVMYMQMGLTDAEVGLYTGWLALPWVVKPLWSPFIDLLKTKRWWVLTMQLLMGSALAGIAFTLPTPMWFQGSMFFLFAMAFASATHDISADGFYMIELDEHNQAKYVGLRNTFYRLAVIFVNGALVSLAGLLEHSFHMSVVYTHLLRTGSSFYRYLALPLPHDAAPQGRHQFGQRCWRSGCRTEEDAHNILLEIRS